MHSGGKSMIYQSVIAVLSDQTKQRCLHDIAEDIARDVERRLERWEFENGLAPPKKKERPKWLAVLPGRGKKQIDKAVRPGLNVLSIVGQSDG